MKSSLKKGKVEKAELKKIAQCCAKKFEDRVGCHD